MSFGGLSGRAACRVLPLLALTFAACYGAPKKVVNAGVQGDLAEDRVGIDDIFDVRVYGEADLSGAYRVATDGTIDYPLTGRLQISGLRTGEIQRLIVTKLKAGFL